MSQDDPRDPTLDDLLELQRQLIADSIHTMLPGKVVSYDDETQLAVCQPLVKQRYLAEDGVTMIAEDLPAVHDCPVVFCGSNARARITWPVVAGDLCELRFSSGSLGRWLKTNGTKSVEPADDGRHELTGATCYVGLHANSAPTEAPTDALVVHVSDGVLIKLGSPSASNAAAHVPGVQAALIGALSDGSIIQAMNTYATAIPGPAKAAALAALVLAVNTHFGTSPVQGSTKVKLE